MNTIWTPARLGLAGGIDKSGSRGAELLATGFDSVEFGTVTPHPEPGANPGVAALVSRLQALPARGPGATQVGIGLGKGSASPPSALPAEWLDGLRQAWGAADYYSFNLSARSNQTLLSSAHQRLLARAFQKVSSERERLGGGAGLALKIELGAVAPLPMTLAEAAADAGFDAVVAVLPHGPERLDRLHALACKLKGKAALLAVGGIRGGADIRAARGAGADGVQVHTLFAQLGAACIPALRFSDPLANSTIMESDARSR